MSKVSLDQSHEVIARIGTNCNWGAVSSEQAQQAINDPKRLGHEFAKFIQNGGRATILSTDGIVPPHDGKVYILTVTVDESRPWQKVVEAAGPDTRGDQWDIWKVGDKYPPTPGAKPTLKQIILVNFNKFMLGDNLLAWGKEQKLRPASPRTCFAIGEHYPQLHRDFGTNRLAVVSLVPCFLQEESQLVCRVWWRGLTREVDLGWFETEGKSFWFPFVHE